MAVGLIAAAYPIAETIAGPAVGILTDRFGRKKWIYTGLIISTLALFAFTLNRQISYLIIVHAVQGVAAAMIIVSSLAMVTDVSTVTNRGREMGIYDFANLGGYFAGIFVAGLLPGLAPLWSHSTLVQHWRVLEQSWHTSKSRKLKYIMSL